MYARFYDKRVWDIDLHVPPRVALSLTGRDHIGPGRLSVYTVSTYAYLWGR